jgi:hypothetical protein
MEFVLYVMLFVTPPALKGQESWSLQNTASLSFVSQEACKAAAETLLKAVQETDTVAYFAWCFPTGKGEEKLLSLQEINAGIVPYSSKPFLKKPK